jgi:hypothetical protein
MITLGPAQWRAPRHTFFMNAKIFRCLVLFCCTAAAGLVTFGTYHYIAQRNWIAQINSPENMTAIGAVQFRAPEATSNALYIAGLFLALGGCFWLKASRASSAMDGDATEESSLSDEN